MPNDIVPTPNISELARRHGLSRQTVRRRLANGWIPPTVIDGVATEIAEQNQKVASGREVVAGPNGQVARTGA